LLCSLNSSYCCASSQSPLFSSCLFVLCLICLFTSLPYAVSNHLCIEFESFLADQSNALPSSCNFQSTQVTNLNQCLLQNSTSAELLTDIHLQGLLESVYGTLISDTIQVNKLLTICRQPQLPAYLLSNILWYTSEEIAMAESSLSTFQQAINTNRSSTSCQSDLEASLTVVLEVSQLFAALLNIVDCGPLSLFYQDTVQTTFCSDLNSDLLWISILTAGVIIALIPAIMISFQTGYRPWTDQRPDIFPSEPIYHGEPIYKPLLEPSAPPPINQQPSNSAVTMLYQNDDYPIAMQN